MVLDILACSCVITLLDCYFYEYLEVKRAVLLKTDCCRDLSI